MIHQLVGGEASPGLQAIIGAVMLTFATILGGRLGRSGVWLSAPWILGVILSAGVFFQRGVDIGASALSDQSLLAFAQGANIAFLISIAALALFGGTA